MRPPKCSPPPSSCAQMLACELHATGSLLCAIDMHAHAGKRGCFLYGNFMPLAAQAETLLYPRLIALHTPHFDTDASSFSAANMASADASEEVSFPVRAVTG
jgi:cytosolic carboxypeptidase protein 5